MDDGEAIARSVEDPTLFAVVYDRYAGDVHRFVMRRLGADLAEDITAETFATALRHRGRYD
ncbi:MAG: sigma factor, partial [Nocardioides sp.]